METDEAVVTSTSELKASGKAAAKKGKAKTKLNGTSAPESESAEIASSSGKSDDVTKEKGRKKQ